MNLLQAFGQGQATFRSQYVSPSAQALYNGLIATMNDNGWKAETMTVDVSMLSRIGNLPLRSAVKKFVNELVLAGLIRIKVLADNNIESHYNGKIEVSIVDKTPIKRAYKKHNNNNNKQQQAQLPPTGGEQQ